MRRARVPTFEEVLEGTSTEWEEMPHGFRLLVSQEPALASRNRLEIELSSKAVAQFRPRPQEKLVARFSRGKLIVERPKPRVRKKAQRG